MTTLNAGTNPFEDPLAERYGDGKDMGKLFASVTEDEVFDYIRNLNWAWEKQTNNYGRWWIGKEVSAGERELGSQRPRPRQLANPAWQALT